MVKAGGNRAQICGRWPILYGGKIQRLVVACITATAAALPDLQAQLTIPVIAWLHQVAKRHWQRPVIGMSGNCHTGTINSGAYAYQLKALKPATRHDLAAPTYRWLKQTNWWRTVQTRLTKPRAIKRTGIDTLISLYLLPLLTRRFKADRQSALLTPRMPLLIVWFRHYKT